MALPWRIARALRESHDYFTTYPGTKTFPGPGTFPGFDKDRAFAELERKRRRRGRPKADYRPWVAKYVEHRALNDDLEPIGGEKRLSEKEVAQLAINDLGLNVTPRYFLSVVKPLI